MLKKFSSLFLILIILFACKEQTSLEKLSLYENSLKTRSTYNSYLALEYLLFARSFMEIKKEKEALYFASKGLKAMGNEIFIPESPLHWKADVKQIPEMVLMQKRLEIALSYPNIKYYLPIQMAHLSFLYDCWISHESTEIFRADELAKCRVRFSKLLDEIELYIDDLGKDKTPKVKIVAPNFRQFNILFDFNSAKFNESANKEMLNVLNYIKTLNGNFRVLVVGNADRKGDVIYNQNLAYRRAKVAKNSLIKNGVNKKLVELRSFGETFPDIITKDGVKNQLNRSAQIYVIQGFGADEELPLPFIKNEIYRKEIAKAKR